MWVFGYGSIIWKPGFEYLERRPGYIEGWKRRFWQASTDHRGVPELPGRVVTLLPSDEDHCWGMAYRLDQAESERIMAQLDHREKGGYERHEVEVVTATDEDSQEIIPSALVYVATPSNPHWIGETPLERLAHRVVEAEGPSGPNVDYVLNLAESLRDMQAEDPHVFNLEAAVRRLMSG